MKIPEPVSGSSNRERKLKLWCPPASKTAVIMTGEEQRLDFGYLGRIFELDPYSLKLNGHFIGRRIDLVSSSVTWISLLNYFSAKGLPTGEDDGHALVVDGKPRKAETTKRARSNENSGTMIYNSTDRPVGVTGSVQYEDGNLVTHKKLKESNPNPGVKIEKLNLQEEATEGRFLLTQEVEDKMKAIQILEAKETLTQVSVRIDILNVAT